MAIQTEPTRIQIPFADSGTKNTIPATNSTPSASQAASWTDGFPTQCSLPLASGGIPPARADFNGIFNTMSQSIRFGQEGGVWAWDATVDYAANRVVLGSDGLLYWSVAQSGPNVGGAQDPTTDTSQTYWGPLTAATPPVDDVSGKVATTQWIENQKLSAALYVDAANGDDTNDGSTAGTALKTLSGLFSLVKKKLEAYKDNLTVWLAAGTYGILEGIRNVHITYRNTGAVTASGASATQPDHFVTLIGDFTLTNNLSAIRGGWFSIGNGSHISFSGLNTVCALAAYGGGRIFSYANQSFAVDFTNCTFSRGTVDLQGGGLLYLQGSETWTGSPTGKRYNLVGCSCLYGGGSPTAIPGTASGTADSTSIFIN